MAKNQEIKLERNKSDCIIEQHKSELTTLTLQIKEQSKDLVKALLKNQCEVSYCEVESSYGHDAFLLEVETLGKMISDFLRNRLEAVRGR